MANPFPTPLGFNGINLDNYFPNQRSYNSVVYVHKRFLTNPKEFEKDIKGHKQNVTKFNKETEKIDKEIQFDGVTHCEQDKKRTRNTHVKTVNDVLTNTVQFAKKLFPLIIPTENYDDPVFYTVKTKKVKKKPREYSNNKDVIYEKNKIKKTNDSSRRTKVINHMESLSAKESVSQLSQNTLDDLNINESLSCTISGISEKKYIKKDCRGHKKGNNKKMVISNSLEALATEILDVNEGANIKIHLMNETDKNIFSENLQIPIVNAIKECITELNQYDRIDSQFQEVQRFIKCNNEKLSFIANKITCLEKKIENQTNKPIEVIKPPNVQASKSSKLEQLGEDLEELSDHLLEDDSTEAMEKNKIYESKSVIATLDKIKNKDEKKKTLGCGEVVSSPLSTLNEVAVKPDRPNRIPTRFCWTDAGRS